jgi:hypothetical protein
MSSKRAGFTGGTDEMGRDMELASALEVLDPAHEDPNYWMRFREWVVTNSAAELARRRLMAELTMSDVMSSWARTLLPTAALAAALAGLMLVRAPDSDSQQIVSVEELLVSDVEGETIPATLGSDDVEPAVTFAAEIF